MEKLTYSNGGSWPYNLNILEGYVIKLIKNQNEIIDYLNSQKESHESE